MNGFELTADLVGALAWPAAIALVAFLLRESIEDLIEILADWLETKNKGKS